MRILIIGLIVFASWSALSTYIYVCKIRSYCGQQQIALVEAEKQNKTQDKPETVDEIRDKPEAVKETQDKPKAVEEKVTIPKDLVINFAFGKSDFVAGEGTSEYIEKSNAYFSNNPQAIYLITGHTDAVGTKEFNQGLGMRRAQALKTYFTNKGMPANKMSIESKGENEPVDNNNTAEGRANNRRTVITIKNQ